MPASFACGFLISLPTVKTHVQKILKKLGGTSRVHVAIAVLEQR